MWEGRKLVPVSGYFDDLITDRAVAYLEKRQAAPFFLYLAYVATHFHVEAPAEEVARHQGTFGGADPGRRLKANYAAMVTRLDRNIGRISQRSTGWGWIARTLIVFTSDQGATFESGNRGRAPPWTAIGRSAARSGHSGKEASACPPWPAGRAGFRRGELPRTSCN